MTAVPLSFLPPFTAPSPLDLSDSILQLMGTHLSVEGHALVPADTPLVVVSNHRSAMDAPVLMSGLRRPIAFACHQYMAKVPVLQNVVKQFGAFPLETPQNFFRQARQRLSRGQTIGLFPEGAQPMVTVQPPRVMNSFHRGFAHLALRAPVSSLAILPVALVSDDRGIESPIPLKLLGWFDPSEPLFQRSGGHPIVFYRHIEVRIGAPIWIKADARQRYRGAEGNQQAQQLTQKCWTTVNELLHRP
ncbi:MAG: lysophospholipid acyltransferase family protein [Cyanobacteria bacterium J06636_16]